MPIESNNNSSVIPDETIGTVVDDEDEQQQDQLDDLRQRGNHAFSSGDYDMAVSLYTAAIDQADACGKPQSLVVNLCNRAAVYEKMEAYEQSQSDASQALQVISIAGTSNKKNVIHSKDEQQLQTLHHLKALYRLAKAQIALRAFGAAVGTIETAKNILLEELQQEQQQQSQKKAFQELLQEAKRGEFDLQRFEEETVDSIKYVPRGISIREFIKGKDLGVGNFSEVVVCHHKRTKEQFCLKIIEKKRAADLAKRQHPNVYNEIQMERRVLLERLPLHPNIVQMYHAFQDYNSLYYLMDLHRDGGDMWSSLRESYKMVGCHKSLAKVYLAELVDALEHMHLHGIVHRDLKPENILFTASGHLLVIDFGTAKDLLQTDLNGPEFVGTPDFMSPEAVTGTAGMQEALDAKNKGAQGADHTLDLYGLGAVAYQLHTGMTPYWSPSPYLTFLKIKRGILMRPYGIADDDAWDFISSLMHVDPKTRLGADCFSIEGNFQKQMVMKKGGYDVIREHPYFRRNNFDVPALDPDYAKTTPIPSLRDLAMRACAKLVQQDANDIELCDRYAPGDGSSHDVTRLDERDRKCLMHHLERLGFLKDAMVYRRFFTSLISYRLDKIRPEARDYIGLTCMTDAQHKFPDPREHDPYAEVKPIEPIRIVQITNPLLVPGNASMDEATRKASLKLFKKCIASINRNRPKLVVCAGHINDSCRKLLARINDSIPVIVIDGSAYFSFWYSGIQCLAVQANNDQEQLPWLSQELEQCRMSKNHLFCFVGHDPRTSLSPLVLKKMARGKAHMLSGLSNNNAEDLDSGIVYMANETLKENENDDNVSIKSIDSDEDEQDNHIMKVVGTQRNGLRCITVTGREEWEVSFEAITITE